MQFAEAEDPWRAIPNWVESLLQLGFLWQRQSTHRRRLALVSLPCPSAGAGVVALGALIRRLCIAGTNDVEAHFRRLERLSVVGDTNTLLRRGRKRTKFFVERREALGLVWVREASSTSNLRVTVSPKTAHEWWFDGEAPVAVDVGEPVRFARMYESMANWGQTIVPTNLTHSDSGLCLAGSAAGEADTRTRFAGLRFQVEENPADLPQLLTIQSWTPKSISRMSYYNCRTGELDRTTGSPTMVVADGDGAFLRTMHKKEFHDSDVIGVIDRTVDRERLELLGQAISQFGQWYAPMALQDSGPAWPAGIAVRTWERR